MIQQTQLRGGGAEASLVAINIPNALTLLRICLIPVLVVVFYLPFKNHLLVAAVFSRSPQSPTGWTATSPGAWGR